ncbi:MAG: C-terminal helicase domain-containing protein, partial [Candidatus Aminicenantes bacterium]|nr:C-terminal helicase domain-containing protein [Candidatus Aminicenantes bacterium]
PNRFKVAFLAEQYRMHSYVASIANKVVYDNKLINKTSLWPIKKCQEIFGILALVNTENLRPICHRTEEFSRFNLSHTLLCLLFAKIFLAEGMHCEQLSVITPYRAQARLLRKILTDFGLEAINCSTVHKFQGREKRSDYL